MSDLVWNDCNFMDCMEGMKNLPDKSIDLCLTDPPWDVDLGRCGKARQRLSWHDYNYFDNKKMFNDNIEDYVKFSKEWFKEVNRICNQVIFTPGNVNMGMWFNIEKPKEILIHYKRDSITISHYTRFCQHDFILCYGNLRAFQFRDSVLDIPACGKGGSQYTRKIDLQHACPKNIILWRILMQRSRPKTVIDPFLGSGTTLQVAIEQGVKCLSFEIDSSFKDDIEKRKEEGIATFKKAGKKVKSSLEGWVRE